MQLDLLNYRRSDPSTSKEAGDNASRFRTGDCGSILGALGRVAPQPYSAEQISQALHWASHVRVNRRLGELERAGLIERTSQRHTNQSGRRAFKYRLTCDPSTIPRGS